MSQVMQCSFYSNFFSKLKKKKKEVARTCTLHDSAEIHVFLSHTIL